MKLAFYILTSFLIYTIYSVDILQKYQSITIDCSKNKLINFNATEFSLNEEMYFKLTFHNSHAFESFYYQFSGYTTIYLLGRKLSSSYTKKEESDYANVYHKITKEENKNYMVMEFYCNGNLDIENTKEGEPVKDNFTLILVLIIVIPTVVVILLIILALYLRKTGKCERRLYQYNMPNLIYQRNMYQDLVIVANNQRPINYIQEQKNYNPNVPTNSNSSTNNRLSLNNNNINKVNFTNDNNTNNEININNDNIINNNLNNIKSENIIINDDNYFKTEDNINNNDNNLKTKDNINNNVNNLKIEDNINNNDNNLKTEDNINNNVNNYIKNAEKNANIKLTKKRQIHNIQAPLKDNLESVSNKD